jgi:MoxR-like ATPase
MRRAIIDYMAKMKTAPVVRAATPSSLSRLADGLETVIRGKRSFLEDLIVCLVSGGHALIEDLPGTGKTTVAKALAMLLTNPPTGAKRSAKRASFKRIQFTPDLLPYDITGVDVFDPASRGFEFRPGPVFANVLLADEINRTTPKVQSALLEAMAEGQVTVGSRTHALEDFFFVIATQNPVESEGTYPLPAAQLDRFMMRLSLGYPDADAELGILRDNPGETALKDLEPVCALADIIKARRAAEAVRCDDRLLRAIVSLCQATRSHPGIGLGVSPRGALMLLKAARARALLLGRDYLIGQDVIDMAVQTLSHRVKAKDLRLDLGAYIREEIVARIERSEKE